MIRGSTPTHIFRLPFDVSSIKKIWITYKQLGRIVLEKNETEVQMNGNVVQFVLTQEESLRFKEDRDVKFQIKVLTTTGLVPISQVKHLSVEEVLNPEIMT